MSSLGVEAKSLPFDDDHNDDDAGCPFGNFKDALVLEIHFHFILFFVYPFAFVYDDVTAAYTIAGFCHLCRLNISERSPLSALFYFVIVFLLFRLSVDVLLTVALSCLLLVSIRLLTMVCDCC